MVRSEVARLVAPQTQPVILDAQRFPFCCRPVTGGAHQECAPGVLICLYCVAFRIEIGFVKGLEKTLYRGITRVQVPSAIGFDAGSMELFKLPLIKDADFRRHVSCSSDFVKCSPKVIGPVLPFPDRSGKPE